jgi:hypothetical protein
MRILITKEGTEIIEELEKNQFKNRLNKNSFLTKSKSLSQIQKLNSIDSTSIKYFSPKNIKNKSNLIDFDSKTPNIKYLKNLKIHNLNLQKINVSKSIIEKYDRTNSTSNLILSNKISSFLSNENKKISKNKSSNNIKILSFNEIIPENIVKNMKIQFINDKIMKNKLSKVDENKFRSIYKIKTDLEKLDDILSFPKINSNKISLIRYLNNCKKIKPKILETLVKSNKEKINKLDKLAEVIMNEDENQKLQNSIIQNKIKNIQNEESVYINKEINKMKKQMDGFKNRLEKYKILIDKKDKYRDLLKDIENNYWNKYNYDKLNKKSFSINKTNTNSFDITRYHE